MAYWLIPLILSLGLVSTYRYWSELFPGQERLQSCVIGGIKRSLLVLWVVFFVDMQKGIHSWEWRCRPTANAPNAAGQFVRKKARNYNPA